MKKILTYIILPTLFFGVIYYFPPFRISLTTMVYCNGFDMKYINYDTAHYKIDLNYSNNLGDTLTYNFVSITKSEGDSCGRSFMNSCDCESFLKIEYYCKQNKKLIKYTFYNYEKGGFSGGSIEFDRILFFYDDYNNTQNYESLLSIDTNEFANDNLRKIYVKNCHLDGYIDSNNLNWKRIYD